MKSQQQIRYAPITRAESDAENRSISGYALVFNKRSEKLYDIWSGQYFYEIISPDACTQEFIDTQDIRLIRNHNEMGTTLARWKKGSGSLNLQVDDIGLHFQFNCPNTPAGDELLDAIRRGDADKMSFAFYTSADNVSTSKDDEGNEIRTINKFDYITELSILDCQPAYQDTSVDNRNKNSDNMNEDQLKELQDKIAELENKLNELQPAEMSDEEEAKDVDSNEEDSEENVPENEQPKEEENREDENTDEESTEESDESVEENNEENINEENKRSINTMNKKNFSLLKAIRSVVETGKLDAVSQAVSDLGAQELRAAGLPCTGQIHIPMEHRDAPVTVNSYGEDVVVTEFTDILEPLRANNVLADAGARIMTGLVGDLQVPTMDAQQVGWAGEITAAAESGAAFDHVLLQPKRLTAYIDVSKQFLVQDSLGAEELIKRDLINAIQTKLESTILGTAAGDTTKPSGIFYGVTPTTVADFGDVCDLEADIEDANFNNGLKYILSPKAKAALRSMVIGTTGPAGMVYVNNEVDGTPALTTTNIATKTFAVGDWSNLVIGQWGSVDLTVDPFSQAANGVVRIVINAFFDAKMVREGAIAYGTFE